MSDLIFGLPQPVQRIPGPENSLQKVCGIRVRDLSPQKVRLSGII